MRLGGGLTAGEAGASRWGGRLIRSGVLGRGGWGAGRGPGRGGAPPQVHSRGFSEDPKALEPAVRRVEAELESLAAENVTDPARIAQAVRRTIGRWVGETYRRQPRILPARIEI